MIIIKLKGGLGNQLFQYAFGRLLALRNKSEVKYCFEETLKGDSHRSYKLGFFNTVVDFADKDEIKKNEYPLGIISKIINKIWRKIFKLYNIGYMPKILNKKNGFFDGYWQSYRYLEPIKKELLEEITLKNPIDEKYQDMLKKIRGSNSVSVHARRGDYVGSKRNISQYVTFGPEYYEQAFNLIKDKIENPALFIFSDDIGWAEENLKSDFPMIFVSKPEIQDYEELVLMSECKHNIIANSSFSFWGAWLNQNPNKTVMAPKKWNNTHQSEYKDLLPKEWIQI